MNLSEFEGISPYNDAEAAEALQRISRNPVIPAISKYLFPDLPAGVLRGMLESVESVDEFQNAVMGKVVAAVVAKTSSGVSYDGIENVAAINGKFLAVSNHRDIILDPAITQWIFQRNKVPLTEICVGSNLLGSKLVEDLLRSNRMIKVIRGISARELYLSSKILSRYIRESICSGRASVWVAQKEGRSKNGMDVTEQGLLKMFDMSGEADFKTNFRNLHIVPVSISYEIEPCDLRKARENYIKESQGFYKKKKDEDLHSILTGIRQIKGGIHLSFGKELSEEELDAAAAGNGNERYQTLMKILDGRIAAGYRIWKNNMIAYDLIYGGGRFSGNYSAEEKAAFIKYADHKIGKVESRYDKARVRELFYEIYANPIVNKDRFGLL